MSVGSGDNSPLFKIQVKAQTIDIESHVPRVPSHLALVGQVTRSK